MHRAARGVAESDLMRRTVLPLLLCLLPLSSFAADAEGRFAVDGLGSRSCTEILVDLETEGRPAAYAAWATGFLTGVNVFSAETYDITPWQSAGYVLAQVRAYCTQAPDDTLVGALGKFVVTLQPRRLRSESALVQVRNGGQAVALYETTLGEVRQMLAARGFAETAADLAEPLALTDALARFQRSAGLPASGLPDLATLQALLLAPG